MNSYPIKGRYGHSMTFHEQEDGTYYVEMTGKCGEYSRCGFEDTPQGRVYRFIDPPGGPFVHVGHHLDDFNSEAPKKKITEIIHGDDRWILVVE